MVNLNDQQKIHDIINFIKEQEFRIDKDEIIYSIMEEEIKRHVVNKLRSEIISDRAFKISCERIPPINIFKLVNKRLSKLYSEPPQRKAIPQADQDLVQLYERNAHVNSSMNICQVMTSAHRRSAIEFYLLDRNPTFRIIPANRFLVYTENQMDKTVVEVFIKFAGNIEKNKIGEDGKQYQISVPLYHLSNKTQFTIIDAEGDYHTELMINPKTGKELKRSGNVINHNYGIIPTVYVNDSHFELMAHPNSDDVELSLLLLTLLTDLNYAVKYQAHSMIYMINVESEKIDMNPDAILDLKSDGEDGEKTEVGTVKPTVDIPGTLKLIAATLKMYLESKGLKVDVNASISSDNAQSGIHETIKNATLIEERKDQIFLYRKVEKNLWDLISKKHNRWQKKNMLKGKFKQKSFDEDFEIEIFYEEQKPVVSRRDKGLMLQTEIDAGLTSQETAIRELKPELSEPEIKEEIIKIDKDKEKNISTDTQMKMNANNKKLAEDKRNRDASNDNSTAQDQNPNKR